MDVGEDTDAIEKVEEDVEGSASLPPLAVMKMEAAERIKTGANTEENAETNTTLIEETENEISNEIAGMNAKSDISEGAAPALMKDL